MSFVQTGAQERQRPKQQRKQREPRPSRARGRSCTFAGASKMSGLGTINAGNVILSSPNGAVNFLQSMSTAPLLGVIERVFDKSFVMDSGQDDFCTRSTGTGSAGREAGTDYITLKAPAGGDRIVFQSKQYINTPIGSTKIVSVVGNLNPSSLTSPDVVARIGCFDDAADKADSNRGDGYFFQCSGDQMAVVRRSSTNGSPGALESIAQADWNLDTLDGAGISKYALRVSDAYVFLIVYEQVAGVGAVKMGIMIDGSVVYCHRFDTPGTGVAAVRTAALPIRFEISNGGGAPLPLCAMKALSCNVSSCGGVPRGISCSDGLKATARNVLGASASTPVMSVRLHPSFARATIKLLGLHLTATAAVYYELVYNGALEGEAWEDSGSCYYTQLDKSATSVTGGKAIYSGYAGEHETLDVTLDGGVMMPLSSDIEGNTDLYTLNVVCLMSSCVCWASLDFEQLV